MGTGNDQLTNANSYGNNKGVVKSQTATPGTANTPGVAYGAAPNPGAATNYPTVNPGAYLNPVGDQSTNWNSGMQNMLGATTGQAAQMGYTNAGAPSNLGATSTYGGANINQAQFNQSYGAEGALANQYGQMAAGNGPSMAQLQAQQSAQQGLANQMAMLGAQRGSSNPGMAAYQAQQLGAQGMQQAAQQAVQGRTQEEMSALSSQGSLLGNMNNQASQFAGNQAQLTQQAQLASMGAINSQNATQAQLNQQQQQYQAGLYQQANQANLQASMSQNGLNAQQYDNYMSMLQQMNLSQYQSNMAQQQQMSSNYLTSAGIQAGVGINQANLNANLAGSVAGGAAGVGGIIATAASDFRSKKKILAADRRLGEMLENVYQNHLQLLMIL